MEITTKLRRHIDKTFIRQQDQTDCGVACLAGVIRFFGGQESLENLRGLCGTNKDGTTLLGLYQGATAIQLQAKGLVGGTEFLRQQHTPAILHIVNELGFEHFVIYYGLTGNNGQATEQRFLIGDPVSGVAALTAAELEEKWKSKALLLLGTAPGFKKQKEKSREKWKWFQSVMRPDYNILFITVMLSLFVTVLSFSLSIFYGRLIDDFIPQKKFELVLTGLFLLFLMLMGKAGLTLLKQQLSIMQTRNFNERITGKFLGTLFRLPKSFFDGRKTGDMVARLNDLQRIQKTIGFISGTAFVDLLIVLATVVILFIYSAVIALISFCVIPVIACSVLWFMKPVKSRQNDEMRTYAVTESSYLDHIEGIDPIKEGNHESVYIAKSQQVYSQYQQALSLLGTTGNQFGFLSEILGTTILLVVIGVSVLLISNHQLLIGEMVAMVSLMSNFMPAVQRLALSNLQVQEARLAFERMHEFAEIEPEYKEQPLEPVTYHSFAASGIAFSFPGRPQLLKDISFSISKKEHIVFLGESGSGKSTLLQLIKRFYQPSAGEFLLNNEPMAGFPVPLSRALIAAVPQDIKLFNATLFENIILGNKASMDQLIAFCRQMGFDQYFSAFPQGYMSLLGAGGLRLSGGQKQLVALARALFRKPKLLLLDEATSAMDSNMVTFVERMLRALQMEGLAIITVTHQPAVACKADRIYVLEQGTVSYEGPYQEWLFNKAEVKKESNI